MKRILALFLSLLLLQGVSWSQNIPPRPNPPKLVNDLAHVLTADQAIALEQKLVAYDDSTSNQVVVVTVSTTGEYPIEDYALKILRDWGVGNKKNNNGVVLLAAVNDRKIRIETGYGLEGAIPDITANQIIRNEIIPNFRDQNYYRGFDEAVDAIMKAAAGEYKAPEGYADRGKDSGHGLPLLGIIIFFVVLLFILSRIGGGGGNGGMMSRGGFLPWLIVNSMLNSGSRGWSGGGGGGSDWGGGGGGGGDFGGFGGGSGGGGGASGSW